MPEYLRKTIVFVLLSAFIFVVSLISYIFFRQFHDLNYQIICHDFFYDSPPSLLFLKSEFIPIANVVFYALMIVACLLGLLLGVKRLKLAEFRSLMFMFIAILLVLLVFAINQLRLYLMTSCQS